MKINDTQTPVLILNCKIGGLAVFRSLGRKGVPVYAVDDDPAGAPLKSKYCRQAFIQDFDENRQENYLDYLLWVSTQVNKRAILIPTHDELALFVANYAEQLIPHFAFTRNEPELIKELISKEGMHRLAQKHESPTPNTLFPKNLDEVEVFAERITFPVMLKGIFVNRLAERNKPKMLVVNSKDELLHNYTWMEDPESPNLMIQEYIPGADDQVFIFNGYFDDQSECLAAFTGFKIRQFPVHTGCASFGECRWFEDLSSQTKDFMKKIGYRGILDIGFRLDPRDKQYKVLDVNPRLGGAFRLFVAKNGMDVVRALYLDLTGQLLPPVVPRQGRRWIIEDYDFISTYHYFQEGSLGFWEWLKSFKGVEEGAWFSWKDPLPFLKTSMAFLKMVWFSGLKKIGLRSSDE